MKRPTWMSKETYASIMNRGISRCVVCDREASEFTTLTFDHIVGRARRGPDGKLGSDDTSNLQIMCLHDNCQKGSGDDQEWSRENYFDSQHDVTKMRTAQRIAAYDIIKLHTDHFTRPFSQISRKLYTTALTVGAGKTLAIVALAFALNRIRRTPFSLAAPRVKRILVVTKERAVRDQLAETLSTQVKTFGICKESPRVGTITDGDQLKDKTWLRQFDIIVCCVQQLWQNNDAPRTDLPEFLSNIQMIVIDEPHFATRQAMEIVSMADSQIVFGMTGSPIDASGATLQDMVLLSSFGWQEANEYDRSMKFLSDDKENMELILEEIGITEAVDLKKGNEVKIIDSNSPDYWKNAEPQLSVLESVIRYMLECDSLALCPGKWKLATHREKGEIPDLHYPIHAMIRADTVLLGQKLCDVANATFEADRARYPKSKGWHATIVHAESAKEGMRGKPLRQDHPWMIAANNDGMLRDAKTGIDASRVLVVVDMAREGLDNKYCGVVGIACVASSVVEHVQRSIGRACRSVSRWQDGVLHVPPARLDTIKIVTHKAFGNREAIEEAISFVMNMTARLSAMPTMEEMLDGDAEDLSARVLPESGLTLSERIRLTGGVGDAKIAGDVISDVTMHALVGKILGPTTLPRRQEATAWVRELSADPPAVWEKMHPYDSIEPIGSIIKSEIINLNPTNDDLRRFAENHTDPVIVQAGIDMEINPAKWRGIVAFCYKKQAEDCKLGEFTKFTNLSNIRKKIAGDVWRDLSGSSAGNVPRECYRVAGSVMKQSVGVESGYQLQDDSVYDIPQVHFLLLRPEVNGRIQSVVRSRLIREGHCPRHSFTVKQP